MNDIDCLNLKCIINLYDYILEHVVLHLLLQSIDFVKFKYKLNKKSLFFDELKLKQKITLAKKVQQSMLHFIAVFFNRFASLNMSQTYSFLLKKIFDRYILAFKPPQLALLIFFKVLILAYAMKKLNILTKHGMLSCVHDTLKTFFQQLLITMSLSLSFLCLSSHSEYFERVQFPRLSYGDFKSSGAYENK
ncbi:hypothetical protein BpHYR1_048145 [Brachionus plicatilis]|uniref:Uncharacterized protein n=1 Tax=Brachionus plicatilis TaxID=10195 RepID=A0A3M7T0V4_BRAPC|nr:hypothetical protein BpHYR1_048145 [Brachionus plicatilis]